MKDSYQQRRLPFSIEAAPEPATATTGTWRTAGKCLVHPAKDAKYSYKGYVRIRDTFYCICLYPKAGGDLQGSLSERSE